MTPPAKFLLRVYTTALHLYPAGFRARYRDELTEAAQQEAAAARNILRFAVELAWDTVQSVLREQWRVAPPVTGRVACRLALLFTAVLLVVTFVGQQRIRAAADRGPEQLLSSITSLSDPPSASVGVAGEITSDAWLQSGASFAVIFDKTGRATTGTATFHGKLPQLPQGLFDTLRAHGHHKVTWQPNSKVRIALVGQTISSGGFAFAGASLRHSEMQRRQLQTFVASLWSAMLIALASIVAASHRKRHIASKHG